MFFAKEPKYALVLAIETEDEEIVGSLLTVEKFVWGQIFKADSNINQLSNTVMEQCSLNDSIKDMIISIKRYYQISNFASYMNFENTPLEKLKEIASNFTWLSGIRDPSDYNSNELNILYRMTSQVAADGKSEIVEWFLSEWKLPLDADIMPNDNDNMNIGLHVGAGKHAFEYCSENYYRCLKSLDALDKDDKDLRYQDKSFLSVNKKVLYPSCDWDGSLNGIIKFVESIPKDKFSINLDYGSLFMEEDISKKVEVIEVLLKYAKNDGRNHGKFSPILPPLAVLVLTMRTDMIKCLSNTKYIDLQENIYPYFFEYDPNAEVPEIEAKDEDDKCAICYYSKKHPKVLDCGHSFCSKCIRIWADSLFKDDTTKPRCPFCRAPMVDCLARSFSENLVSMMVKEFPLYMPFFEGGEGTFTLAEMLFTMSLVHGAIGITEWLFEDKNYKIDPFTLRFGKKLNLMHLVCKFTNVISIHWLVKKGFADLLKKTDKAGLSPIDYVLMPQKELASSILDYFVRMNMVGFNDLNLDNPAYNQKIVKNIRRELADQEFDELVKKLIKFH